MLIEPHNHQVNAAKRAIQTFKDHFISALVTTDSKFPLQLWDKLTSQVETTLNLMRTSCINPNISTYKAIWGPYDWNRFPLTPPGCKAIIYESPTARGSWGSRGTDAWYLGPSVDHYRRNHYFVPKTRAFRILGSAELFPQHCQVLFLSTNDHLHKLTSKVVSKLKRWRQKNNSAYSRWFGQSYRTRHYVQESQPSSRAHVMHGSSQKMISNKCPSQGHRCRTNKGWPKAMNKGWVPPPQ